MKKLLVSTAAVCAPLLLPLNANAATTTGGLDGLVGQPGTVIASVSELCQPPNICETIVYNNWVPSPHFDGVPKLNTWINTHDGSLIVVGYSLGGAVITEWMQDHPEVTRDLRFYTFGNPYDNQTPTNSYDVTNVIHQYDPTTDTPYNWFSLAGLNLLFTISQHGGYNYAEIDDPNNAVWDTGNVTNVLVPADSTVSWVVMVFGKDAIEASYDRDGDGISDNVDPTFTAPTTTTLATQEVTTWETPTNLVEMSTAAEPVTTTPASTSLTTSSEPTRAGGGTTSHKKPKPSSTSASSTSAPRRTSPDTQSSSDAKRADRSTQSTKKEATSKPAHTSASTSDKKPKKHD